MKKLSFLCRTSLGVLMLAQALSAQYHWYKGNLHTHTIESDGDLPLEQVIQTYRNLHYDFLVITDHNMVTPSHQLSTDSLLLINGEEVSATEHWGALGLTQAIDPKGLSRQNIVDRILQQNAIPIINHPRWAWINFSSDDVRALDGIRHLEILNTLTDQDRTHGNGMDLWDDVMTRGRKMFGVAADDFHYLKVAGQDGCGVSYIMVHTTALQQDKILDAIRRGEFYASSGAAFQDLKNDNGLCTVSVIDGVEINFIGAYGQVLKKVTGASATYQVKGNEGYVRVHAKNKTNGHAWSQPLYFLDPVLATWKVIAYSGNHQSAAAGTPLAQPLQIKLYDGRNEPVAGVNVAFKVVSGGGRFGSGDSVLVMTDDYGLAATTPVLGSVAGDSNQVFKAYVPEAPSVALFKATALGEVTSTLHVLSGDGQTGVANHALAKKIQAQVTGASAIGIPGKEIMFRIKAGNGAVVEPQPLTTDGEGKAAITWLLGPVLGNQRLEVTLMGGTAAQVLQATATPTTAKSIAIVRGGGQVGTVTDILADSLVTIVRDDVGGPVQGCAVQYQIKNGQGSLLSMNPDTTDTRGCAAMAYRAGNLVGSHTIQATALSANISANFSSTITSRALPFPLDITTTLANPSNLQVDLLSTGVYLYVDRKITIAQIADTLRNSYIIKTANNDKSNAGENFLELTLNQSADIYIGYDQRIQTPPDWLRNSYQKSSAVITSSDSATKLALWHRRMEAGKLLLGGNLAKGSVAPNSYSMYTVLIRRCAATDRIPPAAPQGITAFSLQ